MILYKEISLSSLGEQVFLSHCFHFEAKIHGSIRKPRKCVIQCNRILLLFHLTTRFLEFSQRISYWPFSPCSNTITFTFSLIVSHMSENKVQLQAIKVGSSKHRYRFHTLLKDSGLSHQLSSITRDFISHPCINYFISLVIFPFVIHHLFFQWRFYLMNTRSCDNMGSK